MYSVEAPLAASEQAIIVTLVSQIGLYGEAQEQILFCTEHVAQNKDFNETIKGAFWTISYTVPRLHDLSHMLAEYRFSNDILVRSYDIASCMLCKANSLAILLLAMKHLPLPIISSRPG